jgi:hypothetical protein
MEKIQFNHTDHKVYHIIDGIKVFDMESVLISESAEYVLKQEFDDLEEYKTKSWENINFSRSFSYLEALELSREFLKGKRFLDFIEEGSKFEIKINGFKGKCSAYIKKKERLTLHIEANIPRYVMRYLFQVA